MSDLTTPADDDEAQRLADANFFRGCISGCLISIVLIALMLGLVVKL